MAALKFCVDNRIGNCPRYYLGDGSQPVYIPPHIQKCVAFVGYRDDSATERYGGTGFFIRMAEGRYGFTYFVTAKHVIDGVLRKSTDGKVIIRINLKAGGTYTTETDASIWMFHPTDASIDVAIVGTAIERELDHLPYPIESIVTDEIIRKEGIGVGDDVFLAGLLKNHPGKSRNIPIVRVGNIAAMAEDLFKTRDFGYIEAYLIESRSTGGISGSPVFVSLSTDTPLGHDILSRNRHHYLLGLIHGHAGDEMNSELAQAEEDADTNKKINLGIAVVVPATKILDVLQLPKCVADRKLVLDKLDAEGAAVPD